MHYILKPVKKSQGATYNDRKRLICLAEMSVTGLNVPDTFISEKIAIGVEK